MDEPTKGRIMLSGFLPGEEHQGVTGQLGDLLDDGDLDLIVVGVIEQSSLTTGRGHNAGKTPTLNLRYRSLEVALNGSHREKLLSLLGEIRSERIGQEELDDVGEAAAREAAKTAEAKADKAPRRRRGAAGRGQLAVAPGT